MFTTPLSPGVVSFVNNGNGSDDVNWTLFEVSTSQSVTFQLTAASLGVGNFFCGTQFTPSDFGGFCTDSSANSNPDDPTSAGLITASAISASDQITFSFIPGATGLPADWVFFSDPGAASIVAGTTTAPEPNTVALLSCGLLALAGFKFLRSQS